MFENFAYVFIELIECTCRKMGHLIERVYEVMYHYIAVILHYTGSTVHV